MMRRWINLTENLNKNLGPISGARVNNSGKTGHLEDILNVWSEGKMELAEKKLLEIEDFVRNFKCEQGIELYRGIVPKGDIAQMAQNGLTINQQNGKKLESWSESIDSVAEFMDMWDRPWVILKSNSSELDTVISFSEFHDLADVEPHSKNVQEEVIVKSPSRKHFSNNEILMSKYLVRFDKIFTISDKNFKKIDEFNSLKFYMSLNNTE